MKILLPQLNGYCNCQLELSLTIICLPCLKRIYFVHSVTKIQTHLVSKPTTHSTGVLNQVSCYSTPPVSASCSLSTEVSLSVPSLGVSVLLNTPCCVETPSQDDQSSHSSHHLHLKLRFCSSQYFHYSLSFLRCPPWTFLWPSLHH